MTQPTVPFALVVEDDPFILEHACDILDKAGFHLFSASDGDGAKDILDTNGASITLLFTDVEMPGSIDGFALARYAASRWPEIAIVVASGRVSPKEGQMPPRATFIAKPFSAAIVHDHLREKLPERQKPEPLKNMP